MDEAFWGVIGMSIAYFFSFLGMLVAYRAYRRRKGAGAGPARDSRAGAPGAEGGA